MQNLYSDDVGTYWTSGTDQGCTGSFAWCAVRKILYKPKWAQGHPVNSTQAQCVSISVTASTAQLETADCAIANNFICEVFLFLFMRPKCLSFPPIIVMFFTRILLNMKILGTYQIQYTWHYQ
jgi:hypothetical protein